MALSPATLRPISRGISSFEIIRIFFALLLIFSLVFSVNSPAFAASQPLNETSHPVYTPGSYVPGEVIVKFREPVGGKRVNNMGLEPERLLRDTLNQTYGFSHYRSLEQMPGYFKFFAGPNTDMEKLVAAISLDPQVEYAEPNYIMHAKSAPPNDDLYQKQYVDKSGYTQSNQWYLSKIGITDLWNLTTGNSHIIAVLDTGVNPLHQDLCLSQNYTFVTQTTASGNGNPYNAFCDKYNWPFGYNFTTTPPSAGALDDNGHGTAVAGIIAGTTNNGLGIAGLNWQAVILPVKVLDATGTGTVDSVAQGITYAADKAARVINLSWSQEVSTPSLTLQDSITYAQNRGSLIVTAAGPVVTNATNPFPPRNSTASYPAAFPGVIGVGATDEYDKLTSNQYGNYVSVVAPGQNILTTYCDFVTPIGKEDSLIKGTPQTGTSYTDTDGIQVTPITLNNTVTKYAYQKCQNPDPQGYPVSGQADPCFSNFLKVCYVGQNYRSLPPGDPAVSSSPVISTDGSLRKTITTTNTFNRASIRSYYVYDDGSSYSAAIVSGLASLIISANPNLSNAQVKALIEVTAEKLPGNQKGQYGSGRVSASRIAQAIIQGGGVIPQPGADSGIRGQVTGISDPADTELNLDPVNRTTTPNSDGGFLFGNLPAGTYYLRLRVKSSGRIMGPVKIMLTGQAGEEFKIQFDVDNNRLTCGAGSVCPSNAPDPSTPGNAFNPSSPMPGSLYFNETQHNLSHGFREFWEKNGGLAVFGFPISEEFSEVSPTDGRTYTVQYFQRNRFEYHPEKQPPYRVLLGLLGSESTRGRLNFPPVDPIPPTATGRYFSETGHTLRNQFLAYWQSKGGLAIFGYPISEPFQEGPYIVQYFERNRFELHPENAGTPYEVLLGLLGTDRARARGFF
jgi:subtilisin family serine protease